MQRLPTEIGDLEPHQVQTYYEAVGFMVASQTDANTRGVLLEQMMGPPNLVWQEMMTAAKQSIDTLHELNTVKEVAKIMRTNNRVCTNRMTIRTIIKKAMSV